MTIEIRPEQAGAAVHVVPGPDRAWAWTAHQVVAAVDLSRRSQFARLNLNERLVRAVGEQAAYVGQLLALPESVTVALRFLHLAPGLIEAYVIVRVEQATPELAVHAAHTVNRTVTVTPDHVRMAPVTDVEHLKRILAPFTPAVGGLAQVHKRIRVARPARIDANVPVYVAIEPFGRQPHPWEGLLEALRTHPTWLAVSIELTAGAMPQEVRRTLETEATRYRRLAQRQDRPNDVGGTMQFEGDAAAATIEPYFLDALRRYHGRIFRFAVTVAAPDPLPEPLVGHIAATVSPAPQTQAERDDPQSILSGHIVARPGSQADHDELAGAFTTLQPTDWGGPELVAILRAEAPPGYRSAREPLSVLRLLVDREEATSLFRLPLALDGHVPGFQVVAPRDHTQVIVEPTGPAVLLGNQPGSTGPSGAVKLAVSDLPRHGFIVGTPGSGKTNTALHLCRQFRSHDVPFVVIEPVNAQLDDYRWLATLPEFDDLLIFTVGDDDVAPFRLNPFQVPDRATVASHVSNLLACFEAAFGLWDPLPFLYRRGLVEAYRRRGFHAGHRAGPADIDRWPVLPEFVGALTEEVERLGYAGETYSNIDAAARLRAEALIEGACGPTLNCRRSYDIGELMHRPVVFELAGVGDNAKEQSLITLLLITAMRGWYRQHRRGSDTPHVILLEEAHRVFPRATPQTGGDLKEGNAQALAAERIAQGLAEDRKYRQSYLLIDQQVGKVAEDAYKITNLKIMHRTAAEDDRVLLGQTMSMHADQISAAAALRPFEAIVSHNALDRAVSIAVPNVREEDARERGIPEAPLAEDEALRARFDAWRAATPSVDEALAPYPECFDCRHRCTFRPRAESIVAGGDGAAGIATLFDDDDVEVDTEPWYSAVPDRLAMLGGDPPAVPAGADPQRWEQDYRVCLFIHAFRKRYTSESWTANDRRAALVWARDVRTALGG